MMCDQSDIVGGTLCERKLPQSQSSTILTLVCFVGILTEKLVESQQFHFITVRGNSCVLFAT